MTSSKSRSRAALDATAREWGTGMYEVDLPCGMDLWRGHIVMGREKGSQGDGVRRKARDGSMKDGKGSGEFTGSQADSGHS